MIVCLHDLRGKEDGWIHEGEKKGKKEIKKKSKSIYVTNFILILSGFGGLEAKLVPKFAGSNPAEAFGFLGRKNPQHASLRRGSKAVGPIS